MKFIVYPRWRAEQYTSDSRYAVISVTDKDQADAALRSDPNRLATLRLKFDDVECDNHYDLGTVAMTDAQADQVVAFVEAHCQSVAQFIIHCEAGISRSRGIALGLSNAYRLSKDAADEHLKRGVPNRHVARAILRAYERRHGLDTLPSAFENMPVCDVHGDHARWRFEDGKPICLVCKLVETQ